MKKAILAGLLLLAVLTVVPGSAQSEEAGTLTINVTGFPNDIGLAMISLHNSAEQFYEKEKPFRQVKLPIKDRKVTYEFKDIPKGTYAVRLYQDENGNGKLDKNMVGYPKEAYGISNNAKSKMGPPKYEKARFAFNGSMTMEIKAD